MSNLNDFSKFSNIALQDKHSVRQIAFLKHIDGIIRKYFKEL